MFAIAPDGGWLAAGYGDGTVRLLEAATRHTSDTIARLRSPRASKILWPS